MQKADDIVPVTTVDGDARMTIAAKHLDHVFNGQTAVKGANLWAWGHDPGDVGFGGLEHLVDQYPFRGLYDARLLAVGHQRSQFVGLEDVLASDVLADDEGRDAVGYHANHVAQGGDDQYPFRQDTGRELGRILDREIDGYRFRCHFAEQQQKRHHDDDVNPAGIRLAERVNEDHGHVGRCRDVHQFVAAEQRDDQSSWLVEHGVDALGIGIARIAQLLKIDATQRKQGGFRTGEKRRHAEEHALNQNADREFPVD